MKTEIVHVLGGLVCCFILLLGSPTLAAPDDQVKPPQAPPTNPTPTNPTPTDPAPTNPTPSAPTPTNPAPTNPTPTNPTPTPTQPSTPPLPIDDLGGQTSFVNPEPASVLLWTMLGLAGAGYGFYRLRKQRHN